MLKDSAKIRQTLALYNSIPNFLWSSINLIPVSVFCYTLLQVKLFIVILSISILTVFLPRPFFKTMRAGKTSRIYKKTGIPFISRFTQNGIVINRMMKKKYPKFKAVTGSKKDVRRLLKQSYMYEKFHFLLFVFFAGVMIVALSNQYWGWAIILMLTNILYNVYPILLQQYVQIRLERMQMTMQADHPSNLTPGGQIA